MATAREFAECMAQKFDAGGYFGKISACIKITDRFGSDFAHRNKNGHHARQHPPP
jgi:hypothetical protein